MDDNGGGGARGSDSPPSPTPSPAPAMSLEALAASLSDLTPQSKVGVLRASQDHVLRDVRAAQHALSEFNVFSEEKYALVAPDMARMAKDMRAIKADIDYVYRKSR